MSPSDSGPLLGEGARADLAAFVGVRMQVVASLVGEVREAMAGSGVALSFIDHAGAMSHVMAGTSADDEVTESSRKLGIDVAAVAAVCDEVSVLGYVETPQRLRSLLDSYTRVLGEGAACSVMLRPLVPDCSSAQNLRDKLAAVASSPAASVGFYHYAMMPLDRLDWIRDAVAQAKAGAA